MSHLIERWSNYNLAMETREALTIREAESGDMDNAIRIIQAGTVESNAHYFGNGRFGLLPSKLFSLDAHTPQIRAEIEEGLTPVSR